MLFVSIAAVYSTWVYLGPAAPVSQNLPTSLSSIKYGLIYITDVTVSSGNYSTAAVQKSNDTNIAANISLNADNTSSVSVNVTFYNSTTASYFYDEAITVTGNNNNIVFDVSGIVQKDEVPSKTYKTVTVTFRLDNPSDLSNLNLISELNFKFTVDKDSIGDIVAISAIDKFKNILNNVDVADSYEQLTTAMDERTGWNKGSAVTYMGNVAGASGGDSAIINNLFGEEFMSMDLDGDGNAESITMMIKRENLDDNPTTGDSYTYTSWGRDTTVNGNEMTIYITANDFTGISNGDELVVYAATFTKLPNSDVWTEVVPLTKGKAEANSYSGGWGGADSFNTDTWVSDNGDKMAILVLNAMNY